ncbi:MAG: YigZ family protein [FCB group bacterium]|nr:YigZ family protein [FCB group bacterium]
MNFTVAGPASARLKVKRSEFLAEVVPISTKSEIETRIKQLKKAHPKARHICWAGRWMEETNIEEYYSDAGEPAGTAGLPILNQLRSNKLVNIGCTVVRHFGGIKLGKRGLIDAYGEAVTMSIRAAKLIDFIPRTTLRIKAPYSSMGHVANLLTGAGGRIIRDQSQIDLEWLVTLPLKSVPDFIKHLEEIPGIIHK